jgi:hypothetical protein
MGGFNLEGQQDRLTAAFMNANGKQSKIQRNVQLN